jgi:hypothetical protein
MVLCQFLRTTTVPELLTRMLILIQQRFYNEEDNMMVRASFIEVMAQDIIGV